MKSSKATANDRPVVIVRKKAGTKSFLSNSTQLRREPPSPMTKVATLATSTAPATTQTGPNKKEREKQARHELLEVLHDRWPEAFPRDYRQLRPLAIGIRQDIVASLPEHPPGRIGAAIRMFQQHMRSAYFRVVLQGGPRYDLEGYPRGEVTAKEQEQARRELHAFYERRKRKTADSVPASSESSPLLEE